MKQLIKTEKEKCVPCGGVKPLLSTPNLKVGKDGVSFTFGFGPSWGWSATEIKGVDVNGTSTSEVYRYDFK